MKVLLADDEPSVLEFLRHLFDKAGCRTFCATDGTLALREFFTARPDLAVVDLLMPNMDGFELCRRIREVSHIPIIVLSALERVGEKVNAFDAGADDYVIKPVNGRELMARVEACMRRSHWPPAEESQSVYSDAYLKVDFARREVYVSDSNITLTPIEYSLLSLFVKRPGEALSLEYLLTTVWGEEYDTFDLVKWHISNLRKKLRNGKKEPSPIATVRGYGYRYRRPPDTG